MGTLGTQAAKNSVTHSGVTYSLTGSYLASLREPGHFLGNFSPVASFRWFLAVPTNANGLAGA
jgi:hypothetical protein